ncbi:MAG: serine/threonine protein kinase [Phormidesmis sp. RL_2_1]|nr:serine/threonine protein kinase [Phormidesmis sp. RL_2_1]
MPSSKQSDRVPSNVLAFAQQLLQPQGLSHIQEVVLTMCWAGDTYQTIAEATGYDDSYIRAVGAQLWHSLSEALGHKVTKYNFRVILKQQLPHEESSDLLLRNGSVIALELPRGQVPLESPFYIERSSIESECYRSIGEPGALIRIKSSRQTGKTSLMSRIIAFARNHDYVTVTLNLELASTDILSDVDRFLRWFCVMVSKALDLPARVEDYWEALCGSSYNCSEYFESYLLATSPEPIVLALDNVDIIFSYPEVASNFFGMLRAWYESARYGSAESDTWQKLRLVVVYSTEVYIPLPIHQSPFNVGMLVELPNFTAEQVALLIARYQLNWSEADIAALMSLVGSNPHLVRLTLYHAKRSSMSLGQIRENAIAPSSIYIAHLQEKFWALQPHAHLLEGIKQVMTAATPQELDPVTLLKLEGMGLVSINHGKASSACDLYRLYFGNLFAQTL